jgi:hypothetical protein
VREPSYSVADTIQAFAVSASKLAATSALAGYSGEYDRTEHVVYIDDNNFTHEIYRTGNQWLETLLLESAGNATRSRDATPVAGYAYSYGGVGTEHVIYIDTNDNVHELYRQGDAWHSGVTSGSIPILS